MRHLRSILYCLVLAPAVWILCGVGFDQDLTGRARDDGGIESLTGVLLLLLAGAAYAILLFSPISPLGPLLSGLGFAGVGAWARIAPDSYAGVWPANITKDGFDLSRPGYGLAVLLAMPLLATALSARRWRAFEPPEILLIGTVGRARGAARVAGTPMASERTTVIPQQRHTPEFVPGFGPRAADQTQLVPPAHHDDDRTIAVPLGQPAAAFTEDADERTTVLPLGRPPATALTDDEPTRFVVPAARKADADDRETEDLAAGSETEEATSEVTAPHSAESAPPTAAIAASAGPAAADSSPAAPSSPVAAEEEETTRNVVADDARRGGSAVRTTPGAADDAAEEVTTRLVLPDGASRQVVDAPTEALGLDPAPSRSSASASAEEPAASPASASPAASADEDDKTQLLALPTAGGQADAGTDHDERTQVIRIGTVEPPGDRTQLLTFPTPGEATTAPIAATEAGRDEAGNDRVSPENTKAMSIVAAERPDPGEDPTTRLTSPRNEPGKEPGEATARPNLERGATTMNSIERPADEAADDTRPLNLPAPRPPAEDETTRIV